MDQAREALQYTVGAVDRIIQLAASSTVNRDPPQQRQPSLEHPLHPGPSTGSSSARQNDRLIGTAGKRL